VNLDEVRVRPAARSEEPPHRQLMAAHHYLGFLPKIGQTLWYVAVYHEQWVALLSFSAAGWKCAVRDRWIGWDFHRQYDYDRLKLIANNSRFLILSHWHRPNLGSKVLSLCQKRLSDDWQKRFGHPLLLLETFVDPQRFAGTVYRAANWSYLGHTRGYRRTRQGYSAKCYRPKKCSSKLYKTMPLCHRFDQVQGRAQRRPENAPTQQVHSLGLRLPAHDRQLLHRSPCLI